MLADNTYIITEIPLHRNNAYDGKRNWKSTSNKILDVMFKGVPIKIFIHNYDSKKRLFSISKYKENCEYYSWDKYTMNISQISNCMFENVLSDKCYNNINKTLFKIDYKMTYKIFGMNYIEVNKLGHSANTTIYIKCKKCGCSSPRFVNSITENMKCSVCRNRFIIKGVNDLNTTNPELAKYFVDKKEIYKYSAGSGHITKLKCPICNHIKEMPISQLYSQGFGCSKCGDGISYPEKFMMFVLDSLHVKYIREYKPNWSDNRRFDYYIPQINTIIEMHGEQHYTNAFTNEINKTRLLDEEKSNDKIKYSLAVKNNIDNYIVIDSRYSNSNYIKNNIIKSKLSDLFNLENIDWKECAIYAENNLLMSVCELYNQGVLIPKEIAKILHCGRTSVARWLKKGTEFGLCSYNASYNKKVSILNDSKKIKIILDNDVKEFNSIREASRYFNIDKGTLQYLIKSKRKYKPRKEELKYLSGMMCEEIMYNYN